MKSRTSYFNPTAFKKDILRFAPSWVLYTVLLLMGVATIIDYSNPLYRTENIVEMISVSGLISFVYALINAQLLFGDLCNSRLCNALHAMPLRRECWFGSHISAGLLFSFVPNLVIGLLSAALMFLGKGWSVPFWWILASCIQYLFFFGLAVLCMMLAGNRFAQILIYGIVNFFSLLVYWLVDSLYEPLLHGIRIPDDPFFTCCPVSKMISGLDLVDVVRGHVYNELGGIEDSFIDYITIGPEWGYMILCALLGVAMLAAALVLYRKRKLECAGDFIAFRFVEPVFLILYTICAGAFLHLFSEMFSGVSYLFLAIGIAVGFFTGLMLLRRTTRVFRKKAFAHFALFTAVFVLTLVLTWLDPLRITYRVPEMNEIKSVTLSSSTDLNYRGEGEVTLTDAAEIQDILDIHRASLKGGEADTYYDGPSYDVNIRLEYTMADGRTMNRFYQLDADCAAAQTAKIYFSSVEAVLGVSEEKLDELAECIGNIYFDSKRDSTQTLDSLNIDVEEMLRAIAADCREGNMAQMYAYHYVPNLDRSNQVTYIEMELKQKPENRETYYRYLSLNIYEEARHTLAWLEENDLMPEPDPGWG